MQPSAGVSLKPPHFSAAAQASADGLWFEIHAENYFVDGGPRLAWLERLRADHPIAVHGVGLSLASVEAPDRAHLGLLRRLCERLQPLLVTEHLAWSRWQGVSVPDLLPVPRTQESLSVLCAHIGAVQDALGRRIAIENPSHYLALPEHSWDEVDFLGELVMRSGCALLLDANNVFVSSHNLGFDPAATIDRFPADAIVEIHLAGHRADGAADSGLLIDSHDAAVADPVWALYERLVRRIGPRPTLIERDGRLPAFEALLVERDRAARVLRGAATMACPA